MHPLERETPFFHDALSSSSKRLGLQRVRCSVSVSPIRRLRETIAVADASQKSASWDEARASVCCYWFDLRDERCWDVRGTSTARECSRHAGFVESRLEQGLYYLHGPSGLEALVQEIQGCLATSWARASFENNSQSWLCIAEGPLAEMAITSR